MGNFSVKIRPVTILVSLMYIIFLAFISGCSKRNDNTLTKRNHKEQQRQENAIQEFAIPDWEINIFYNWHPDNYPTVSISDFPKKAFARRSLKKDGNKGTVVELFLSLDEENRFVPKGDSFFKFDTVFNEGDFNRFYLNIDSEIEFHIGSIIDTADKGTIIDTQTGKAVVKSDFQPGQYSFKIKKN